MSSQLNIASSTNEARYEAVLARLKDQVHNGHLNTEKMDDVIQQQATSRVLNEAGLRAIHSSLITTSSSNLDEHKTTRAILSQYHGFRCSGTAGHSGHPVSTHYGTSNSSATDMIVFWSHFYDRIPIGRLRVTLIQNRQIRNSGRSTQRVCTKTKFAIQFAPPRWLSKVVINYSMKLSCDSISSQWRWGAALNPLTVNYNLFFIKAVIVKKIDVEGVRRSFAEGLARPTDYLVDHHANPVPWYQVRLDLVFDLQVLNRSYSAVPRAGTASFDW